MFLHKAGIVAINVGKSSTGFVLQLPETVKHVHCQLNRCIRIEFHKQTGGRGAGIPEEFPCLTLQRSLSFNVQYPGAMLRDMSPFSVRC